jgi:hypothetical protein
VTRAVVLGTAGANGFAKGLGAGVVGAVVMPVAGIVGGVHDIVGEAAAAPML